MQGQVQQGDLRQIPFRLLSAAAGLRHSTVREHGTGCVVTIGAGNGALALPDVRVLYTATPDGLPAGSGLGIFVVHGGLYRQPDGSAGTLSQLQAVKRNVKDPQGTSTTLPARPPPDV